MLLHTFTTKTDLTINVVLRTYRDKVSFDVMDSNWKALTSEPLSNLLEAIDFAKRQVDLVNADQKNIVALGAMYPRPTIYGGASIWTEVYPYDLVLLNGTHICVVVEADGGCEVITTSDILTKGYGGRIAGTLNGKEMAAVPFSTNIRLEVILDARLTDGDLTAVGFLTLRR